MLKKRVWVKQLRRRVRRRGYRILESFQLPRRQEVNDIKQMMLKEGRATGGKQPDEDSGVDRVVEAEVNQWGDSRGSRRRTRWLILQGASQGKGDTMSNSLFDRSGRKIGFYSPGDPSADQEGVVWNRRGERMGCQHRFIHRQGEEVVAVPDRVERVAGFSYEWTPQGLRPIPGVFVSGIFIPDPIIAPAMTNSARKKAAHKAAVAQRRGVGLGPGNRVKGIHDSFDATSEGWNSFIDERTPSNRLINDFREREADLESRCVARVWRERRNLQSWRTVETDSESDRGIRARPGKSLQEYLRGRFRS
jgi:hypothetical protein